MPNIQALSRRIKTATNIKQITKAMEMVAASKMRRAQAQALSSRPYSQKLYRTLQTIATLTDPSTHPLLTPKDTGTDIVVILSTDKSLAGSLNTNLFRETQAFIDQKFSSVSPEIIIIGQKARHFSVSSGFRLHAEFSNLPDPIRFADIIPITSMLIHGFEAGQFRSVTLLYMDFVSTLIQRFRAQTLLPFTISWEEFVETPSEAIDALTPEKTSYTFEPNAKSILNWLLPYYVEMTLFQTILESRASEHSARMVAMKNASDNATDIIADLTLAYNKQRQAKITTELLDNITASLIVN